MSGLNFTAYPMCICLQVRPLVIGQTTVLQLGGEAKLKKPVGAIFKPGSHECSTTLEMNEWDSSSRRAKFTVRAYRDIYHRLKI